MGVKVHKKKNGMQIDEDDSSMDTDVRLLEKSDPSRQESLACEAEIDPMEGEQTMPTDEELAEAEAAMKVKSVTKRVPKGTSDYQACWITDSGDEEGGDDSDEEDDDDDDEDMDAAAEEEESDEEASGDG